MSINYILNDDRTVTKKETEEDMSEVTSTVIDYVNHPPHYVRSGAMECIDEMVLIFGEDAVANYCVCNAWKYRYRAHEKNGTQDIAKSDWYIKKYKELKEQKKNKPHRVRYVSYPDSSYTEG